MKALLQRVSSASVEAQGRCVGSIGPGLLALLGISRRDTGEDVEYICRRLPALRIFEDADQLMNLSLLDTGGGLLVVSQFTLYADTGKGNRPGFSRAAGAGAALPLYRYAISLLRDRLGHDRVAEGLFGARMRILSCNEGPVTVEITSENRQVGSSGGGGKRSRGEKD